MRRTRINILITLSLLLFLGIVMIYSATCVYAKERYHDGMFFLKRQVIFIGIGLFFMFLAMTFDYRLLKDRSKILLLIAFLLLIAVLIPSIGREAGGARRWFRLWIINFQPSEFGYLALIVYVADFISRKKMLIQENFTQGILPVLLVVGSMAVLVLLQPDLGTAFTLGLLAVFLVFVAGTPLRYIFLVIGMSLLFFYILISSSDYRKARMLAFINPWQDPKGSGFQIIQSHIALGSGGLFGRGLGHSRQKLFYLPACHTDFIFSIIGEELGLLGTLSVVLLFVNLILQGFRIVRFAQDTFGTFLGLGIVLLLSLKAGVNIGVSSGILPTKGLPLPFISYGGSSLVFDMIGIGLLLNISRFSE